MIGGMPTFPTSAEQLQALGRLIRARRDRLGLRIEDAVARTVDEHNEKPMSPTTWARIEKGQGGRAHGRTYLRIENVIRWAPGACGRFLDDGTEPGLAGRATAVAGASASVSSVRHADELAAQSPPLDSTTTERDGDGRFRIRIVDKAGREVVVLAFPDNVTMTPETIEYLAKIAAGVSLGEHVESEPDA